MPAAHHWCIVESDELYPNYIFLAPGDPSPRDARLCSVVDV